MKPADDSRQFGRVPRQLEPLQPDHTELFTLFGDLSENQFRLLHELQTREPELRSWVAADPGRAALLESDPKTALGDLFAHLRMDDRELKARLVDIPPGWAATILKPREIATGEKLMEAVWRHLNAAAANLTAFTADPLAVVATVAAATGASAEERKAVTDAFSTVLGIHTLSPGGGAAELARSQAFIDDPSSQSGVVFLYRK